MDLADSFLARPRKRRRRPHSNATMMVKKPTMMMTRLVSLALLLANGVSGVAVHPRHCGGAVRHVHLSVGADPSTEMIVSFATIPSKYRAPVAGVMVGTSPSLEDAVVHMELGESSCYNLTVSSKKANYGDKYFSPHYHHVTVSGLAPSTTYYYKPIAHARLREFSKYNVRNGKTSLQEYHFEEREDLVEEEDLGRRQLGLAPYDGSRNDCPAPDKIRSFKTAPAPATPGDEATIAPISIAIIGDLGQFPHSEETMTHLVRSWDDIDSIILAGDIAYTQNDHRRWDTFFDFFDDYLIADKIPIQIVPGNHDIEKLDDTEEELSNEIFLAYEHRFRMPRVKPPKLGLYNGPPGKVNLDAPIYPLPYEWGNAYYAYSYGPVRFIMISSYSSMEPDSEQYKWIIEELLAVDRSVTPWVVAVLHTPLYNTFALHHKDLQIAAAKENLEPLFVQYKVNMVFSGHIHAYLRTSNVVNEVVEPTGPVHITVGAGGRKCEAPFQNEEPEPWVEVRDATIYGYGMFKVVNSTHAQWDWIHTGVADDHSANQLLHSEKTLPSGPSRDQLFIENQFFK